ncbi:MAG TPA: hypothetical protein VHL98_06680 [Microvirga sp.]|jgi:hypothetical protein|nr:hypothetical protein [Microvirga sp.]
MRVLAGLGFGLMAGVLAASAQEPAGQPMPEPAAQEPGTRQTSARMPSVPEPAIWRDPIHGCAYLLPPQGGISLRYRPDGRPDCTGLEIDPTATGSVAPEEAAEASARDAGCLLFSASCVTRDAALGASGGLEPAGTSLRGSTP